MDNAKTPRAKTTVVAIPKTSLLESLIDLLLVKHGVENCARGIAAAREELLRTTKDKEPWTLSLSDLSRWNYFRELLA